ncbi:MAG: endo alpha-1,4 polygalactosaminidase [Vicinamibacterales bacterium]
MTLAAWLRVAVVWLLAGGGVRAEAAERWVVCYTAAPSPFDLAAYDVVVLDGDVHPPLGPIVDRGRTALAYLSLTQLGRGRDVFAALDAAGVVLDAHPVWGDAHYLDFRRPEWTRTVIEDLVPRMLSAGFTGLFLDTLDDAAFLEGQDPVRYRGMREAAVRLVQTIRQHYPDVVLMVNRGYDLMPDIAGSIDIVLGESVLTTFEPTTKAYARVAPADAAWQVSALRRARARNPRLQVFTLDYWDPADREGIRRLYAEQRANGFVPYVATPLLDVLVEEPR